MRVGRELNLSFVSFRTAPGICFACLCAAGAAFGGLKLEKADSFTTPYEGLSGITYCGGDDYYIVQDHDENNRPHILPVTIKINRSGTSIGKLESVNPVQFGAGWPLTGTGDAEGIAFDPCSLGVWVSDEGTSPNIRDFRPTYAAASLAPQRAVTIPEVFKNCRGNLQFEALTISGDGLTMWTANEEALTVDDEVSSSSHGTLVRLVRYKRTNVRDNWTSIAQYAYRCEKTAFDISGMNQCGLCGLCALPDGSLLTLEREVSMTTCGRCEIYRLTSAVFSKATDVSSIGSLQNTTQKVTALDKGDSLYTQKGGSLKSMPCFEGICLGPRLDDGSLSVLLVSDGQTRTKSIPIVGDITAKTLTDILVLRMTGYESGVATVNYRTPATDDDESVMVGRNYRLHYSTAGMLSLPPETETVSGIDPWEISIIANGRNTTKAYSLTKTAAGDIAVVPNPAGTYTNMRGETVTVVPQFSTGLNGTPEPFVILPDRVTVGVKTIPGFTYRLRRSRVLNGPSDVVGGPIRATGDSLTLEDREPPSDCAFYVLEVVTP